MNYQEYIVKTSLDSSKRFQVSQLETVVTYEEVFKWKWLSKLKVFSFVAYSRDINRQQIESLSCYFVI